MQLFADAEEWRSFELRDPHGKLLVNVKAKGRVRRFGLSELFVEASEPAFTEFPFSRFKQRFPKGRYRFRAGRPTAAGWSAPTPSPTWCPRGPM